MHYNHHSLQFHLNTKTKTDYSLPLFYKMWSIIFTFMIIKVTFSKSPPEYFLFSLTFPSCTPVEFCNTKMHHNTFWSLKGAFALKYFLLVLTLTGRVHAGVSKPNKTPTRIIVGCIVVFQTAVFRCKSLNELLTSTESNLYTHFSSTALY